MSYRDELDAALALVDALKRDLAEAERKATERALTGSETQRVGALERRVEQVSSELSWLRRDSDRRRRIARVAVLFVVIGTVVSFLFKL